MHKKILLSLLFSLFLLNSFSQRGKIPLPKVADLASQFPEQEVILLESNISITFGYNRSSKKVTVIEELTDTFMDLDHADIAQYVFYDGESSIEKFKVNKRNYMPLVSDEAYTSSGLFHNDTRVKYTKLSFDDLGDTNKTYIKKKYRDIKYLTSLYFTDSYPILKKTIQINVPKWLDIDFKEFNFEGYEIEKEVVNNKEGQLYKYTIKDVHANYKDHNAPGPTYIYPHLLLLPKSHTKERVKKVIFEDTQDLYNWYKSLVDELNRSAAPFKLKVKELIKDATTDEEKAKRIFYWVQDNIRYIAFEDGIAGFKPDEASNVFKKKYGDCKGMANLTKEMLTEAGLDARLTWIGTKRIAYDYSTPSLAVDNHMICTYFKDGEKIYLDATEDFNAFGEYANRIQGKQVLIENGKDYILETVPSITADFNKELINYEYELVGEELVGKASKKFKGESRTYLLQHFNTIKNDKKEDFLKWYLNNGDNNITLSNIQTSDLDNREIDIDISYDIKVKNRVSSFDGTTYIDVDIDKELSGFKLEDRKTDYIFGYRKFLETITTVIIPDTHKITSLPKNIEIENENYTLSVVFSQENNKIIYKKSFVIKNAKIAFSAIDQWNDFIAKLNTSYNESIIISKK